MEWYDWNKTFSYSKARWVMVISARGYGKTYGLRKQCIRDYIKKKRRFVVVVRYKSEVGMIARGFFDKMIELNEFPNYSFKYESNRFYMQRAQNKPYELIGYIVALTDEQITKNITFSRVKRFIFDEALIEHKDRYKRYLPGEYGKLVGLRSSITRETPENPSDSIIYLLGNSVDFTSPYFEDLGIKKIPSYGRHIYQNGDVLLDYVEPIYFDEYREKTVIGRALGNSEEGRKLFANEFITDNTTYIDPVPKGAKYWRGYIYAGTKFGLWLGQDGYCHISSKVPKNAKLKAFTLDDDSINYDLIRKSGNDAKTLRNIFYAKLFRYDNAQLRERFSDMLLALGIV